MLLEQIEYIKNNFVQYPPCMADFKYVMSFYHKHNGTKPTDTECRECLDYLDAQMAEINSMIIVRKSYQEAGTDVPQMELEYPRVKRYMNNIAKLRIADNSSWKNTEKDRQLGD